jgi:hypothetical protein
VKDITPQKLLFAFAVLAAVTLAVWSGAVAQVEAPVAAATPSGGFNTPF